MSCVRIKRYKVTRAGTRGLKVILPQVWVDDVGISKDDSIDVFRDTENRLIIVKAEVSSGKEGCYTKNFAEELK